jgi:hypothetical protein
VAIDLKGTSDAVALRVFNNGKGFSGKAGYVSSASVCDGYVHSDELGRR